MRVRHSTWSLALLAASLLAPPASAQGYLVREFTGATLSDFFGRTVAGAGDQDADGTPDVVVGAQTGGGGGRAYLFSGATGTFVTLLVAPGIGRGVANGGDMDGDGIPEIVAGGTGGVAVFQGGTSVLLYLDALPAPGPCFGLSVAGAGDLDGDGVPDYLGGATSARARRGSTRGRRGPSSMP